MSSEQWVQHKDACGILISVHKAGDMCLWCVGGFNPPQPSLHSSVAAIEREQRALSWLAKLAKVVSIWRGVVRSGPLVGVRK